jgi:hypothetical protein
MTLNQEPITVNSLREAEYALARRQAKSVLLKPQASCSPSTEPQLVGPSCN